MTLRLSTAGESHGPALVAILTGLPAGLELDRAAIDADLRRRQEGYGRSPRQQIEQDRVEVLAGLRHGRTLGTPLALVVRERRPQELDVGDEPLAARRGRRREGREARDTAASGACGSCRRPQVRPRRRAQRSRARLGPPHRGPRCGWRDREGAARHDRDRGRGASLSTRQALRRAVDEARSERDTVGGVVQVRATGAPPGLGSYAAKEDRLDARLAAALMGIQAVKGVEIGDGFAVAGLRGSQAHDEIRPDRRRDTNHAGGIEGGVSNGEEIVVRAAMKPLPTLMKPLRSVDLATGEQASALVERSDVAAVEALAVVAEAAVAWELAVASHEKFGGDAIGDLVAAHGAYLARIEW